MRRTVVLRTVCLLAAACSFMTPSCGEAAIEVAGELLVDLSAADPTAGESTWVNHGTLGDFSELGDPTTRTHQGVPAVFFAGGTPADGYVGPSSIATIEGSSDRSIEAWVNNPTIADEETILSWSNRGGPNSTNMSFNYGSNLFFGAIGHWGLNNADMAWGTGNNSNGDPVTPQIPPVNVWHHLVYTFDGTTARLYVDGAFLDSEVPDPPLNTHAGFSINLALQRFDTNWELPGTLFLAAVRIHSESLTAAQVLNNFREGPPGDSPGPLAVDRWMIYE